MFKLSVLVSVGLISILFPFGTSTALQEKKDIELNTVLMESTFKIEGHNAQGQPTFATAFIMGRPYPNDTKKARYVLITAAHVLDEMSGNSAILDLRRKVDSDTWTRIPLLIEIRVNGRPAWTRLPDADVAVMYVRIPEVISIPLLSTDLLANDEILAKFEIHPGDELECLGYPLGAEANEAGFPILRSGKIASFLLSPTTARKTFLFDFRVFKGNSGGPVYFVQSNRTYGGSTRVGETIHFIVGLVSQESLFQQQVSGPYSEETRQLQLGLAVVVHASLIRQAIGMLPSPETLSD